GRDHAGDRAGADPARRPPGGGAHPRAPRQRPARRRRHRQGARPPRSARRALMARAALLLIACSLSACASRQWLRAESPHLVVYSEVDDAGTRDAIDSVEGFAAFFEWATQCKLAPSRLSLYLVDSASELQRTWPESTNTACYVVARGETFAVAIHDKSSLE